MPVENGNVVTVEYTLTTQKGELIESSLGRGAPIAFIVGQSGMIPGIDKRLVGMEVDQEADFDLPPEDAFGTLDSGPSLEIPKREFPPEATFEIGTRFQANLKGNVGEVTFEVLEDRVNDVLVRFIHPLAGKTIHAKIKVLTCRPATAEETAAGQPA